MPQGRRVAVRLLKELTTPDIDNGTSTGRAGVGGSRAVCKSIKSPERERLNMLLGSIIGGVGPIEALRAAKVGPVGKLVTERDAVASKVPSEEARVAVTDASDRILNDPLGPAFIRSDVTFVRVGTASPNGVSQNDLSANRRLIESRISNSRGEEVVGPSGGQKRPEIGVGITSNQAAAPDVLGVIVVITTQVARLILVKPPGGVKGIVCNADVIEPSVGREPRGGNGVVIEVVVVVGDGYAHPSKLQLDVGQEGVAHITGVQDPLVYVFGGGGKIGCVTIRDTILLVNKVTG
jgi:hypothetical protein